MKKPNFYCTQFIECNSNLKKYQPEDCKEQCSKCMDIIIDHHFNKKVNADKMMCERCGCNFNNKSEDIGKTDVRGKEEYLCWHCYEHCSLFESDNYDYKLEELKSNDLPF